MRNITFISTIHSETGKCNAEELFLLLTNIKPEVIFLEALTESYSEYDKKLFSSFNIYHKKLEIKAIQKYNHQMSFKYVPVLNNSLSNAFEQKCNIVCENIYFKERLDNFNLQASNLGFNFLNSFESMSLQEEMRMMEDKLIDNKELLRIVSEDIDAYENAMIQNIYTYSKNEVFETAIFMCGVAHRKSIIEKLKVFNHQQELSLNWIVFGN